MTTAEQLFDAALAAAQIIPAEARAQFLNLIVPATFAIDDALVASLACALNVAEVPEDPEVDDLFWRWCDAIHEGDLFAESTLTDWMLVELGIKPAALGAARSLSKFALSQPLTRPLPPPRLH